MMMRYRRLAIGGGVFLLLFCTVAVPFIVIFHRAQNPPTAAHLKAAVVCPTTYEPASPPSYPSPWQDGSGHWATAVGKARAFVDQLTILEMVNLTTGVGWQGEACVGNAGSIPRLGFRALCMQDSPVGVRSSDYNSAFPAGGTVAASWDRQVWHDRGYAMGQEHNDKGVDVVLGPVVGPLGRSPEGGRNWEGFSPDPYLSGQAVYHTVQGVQAAGVVACTKHFIGNEQEHYRMNASSNIDDVTLHELYLWPFADAVRAGTGAIMCSYNQVNNSFACQNSYLLNSVLKGELGFQGFVMSDWSAQHSGVASTLAGLDMSMPGDTGFNTGQSFWGGNLTASVINGTVPAWRLQDMATRIMSAYYYVDRDTHQIPVNFQSWTRSLFGYEHAFANSNFGQVNFEVNVRANHGQIIRDHAAKSTVLLKNTHSVLPLTGKEKLTALFGDDAGDNPLGPNGCPDRGCNSGTLAMGWGSGTTNYPYLISPLTAIQNELLRYDSQIQFVINGSDVASVTALAPMASVALVFVSADSGEDYITVDGAEGDRNDLTLAKNGDALIANVTSLCNNTIVVIHSVGPVDMSAWANNPNVTAILWAGLPGEQSGMALTDILYGRVNPGGKLPFTVASKRQDYGTDILYETTDYCIPQVNFTEGILIDYRWLDSKNITPTYEFGFGLSYTTFEYSNLTIKRAPHTPLYTQNSGMTAPAPSSANFSHNPMDYQFPSGINPVLTYIYPYLSSNSSRPPLADNSPTLPTNSTSGLPQPKPRAGGAPGGNPRLYDTLYTVSATVRNTGKVPGDEVVQLYLSLGGPTDAPRVLRGFERVHNLAPGANVTVKMVLNRKDVMNWNTDLQDWDITAFAKTVYVGGSSRSLPLSAALPVYQ